MFIFNANVLREGIDVKICDAIVFFDKKTSFF